MAGVSVTTVSLYLHGKTSVCSTATASRIKDAVKTLHYNPTPLVGSKLEREQRSVGLLAGTDIERGNPLWVVYNMRFVKGIFQVANAQDYCVINYPFSVSLKAEYRTVLDGRVDGILFYGSCNDPLVELISKAGMPVVCFGSPIRGGIAVGNVHIDEFGLIETAMRHLARLGHTKVAFFNGPFEDCPSTWVDEEGDRVEVFRAEPVSKVRLEAFIQMAEQRDLYLPEMVTGPHAWRGPVVAPEVDRLLSLATRPTAIMCANDYIARAVLKELEGRGISVPQEISVIGIDNIDGLSEAGRITSVDIDVEEVGRQAMDAMVDYLLNGESGHLSRVVPAGKLIVRSTTGPALV